ncbi:MAG: rhodanese-like domain-containing protein [Bacteroidota bacterium]
MKLRLICFVLFLLGISCKSGNEKTITLVDKAFMQEKVVGKNVQLVDVRTPEEFNSGRIAGAVNYNIINREVFLTQIEDLDKDQPVYLYCKMGGRSNRAAQVLKQEGFTKIFDFSGGYNAWVSD